MGNNDQLQNALAISALFLERIGSHSELFKK
jgi:mRNA-degrading endonuclease YafQ of YafQ-DinJ toxin-antitoxin module